MPIQSMKNPYRGINAHLHSIAQNLFESPSIWHSFHTSHIGDITNALNQQLPNDFVARPEHSLQIWVEDFDGTVQRRPEPDVAIFRTSVSFQRPTPPSATVTEDPRIQTIEVSSLPDDEGITLAATAIYQVTGHETLGKPVTRIELLSPSNKHGGSGEIGYQQNRTTALRTGTSLIELDFLHQSVSPLASMPAYPSAPDSHAYTIAVTDGRHHINPNLTTLVYLLDVDTPLPSHVQVPLSGNARIEFDFNAVYHYTFEVGRWGKHLDYTELPRKFETYSLTDQDRIKQVMQRV
ncbi:MAG: hypothetical protein DPW16_01800 [Chloroflexi bacterium]|nr:hypothetical protein [Chloroflexota bacterium]